MREGANMKNAYFLAMRKMGAQYRANCKNTGQRYRDSVVNDDKQFQPLFSEGQSCAYKFWSIADEYGEVEIVVDEFPSKEELQAFVHTYREAGITSIVVIETAMLRVSELLALGCIVTEPCIIKRKVDHYSEKTETKEGLRVNLENGKRRG